MLSPLKPLLCRHEFYWSERHRCERCRRCGKAQAVQPGSGEAEAAAAQRILDRQLVRRLAEDDCLDVPQMPAAAAWTAPSAKVLRAQAKDRRDSLLALLGQLAAGAQPSRRQAIDAVLAVIEDAHSADPVLFGSEAAAHFARLHNARSVPEA